MLKIGLTGGIGSGKTTVARLFAELNITIIDADLLAHQLTRANSPLFSKIVAYFGEKIITPHGELNRVLLKTIIFENPTQRSWLENLLHPPIVKAMQKAILEAKPPYCLLVIPLLIETQHFNLVDRILVVDLPFSLQKTRVLKRDQISEALFNKIIQTQCSQEERLHFAQDIIYNDKNIENLSTQVNNLDQKYRQLCKSHVKIKK